ncbi:hypothetical protein [Luteolibacter sp. LG18]|uniref:immunity protein Imm33 domain-containing protein n=1 Tax=Luteolibacter sp. LG18 TaxID=2819286 RepID=UPI002B304BA4|nr:hypothetical protein llg_35770 [Luteolibacter sp. LG18]
MKLSTRNSPPDQPDIVFQIEAEGADLARWVIDYFEARVRDGTRFHNNETVQLGWGLLLLRQNGDVLEVFEPDFKSMPIQWCPGVNHTIRHLHLQRSVCDLFNCDPMFPSLLQAGIVSPRFTESRDYTMSRDNAEDPDSGWLFAETGYPGPEAEFCSLYQLGVQKPEIVPFLALPVSSHIAIGPGRCEITVDSVVKSAAGCEVLHRLMASCGLS